MALATLAVVVFTTPYNPFFIVPEDKVPDTPVSTASAQPSPSESKSKRLGIPSLSVSISVAPHKTLNSPKNILYAAETV